MILINTMSQAGYTAIIFVIVLCCLGLCILLFFLSRHERKRFKESKITDNVFKTVDFDSELKKRVTEANGKTKFTIVSFYIENVHGVKQMYNAQSLDGVLDAVAARLKRIVRYECTVAVLERKQIVLFVSKHVANKELIILANRAIAEVRKPIAMPDSGQLYLELNVASVYYPEGGTEPIRLFNNLQSAVASARRNGLSKYVAYAESLEADNHNLGAYFEYQRQMSAHNVGIFFRRVIEEGSLNASIIEGEMRYRREEMNDMPILQLAELSGDEIWLGRYYYEHAMSQLKRINDKTTAHKKLIIRLSNSQITDGDIVGQLVKATGNNGLITEDIIIGLDAKIIALCGKSLSEYLKPFDDAKFSILLYGATMSLRADQLTAMGVDYLEIDAKNIVDGVADGIDRYINEVNNSKTTIIAGAVDRVEYVKIVHDLGVKLLLGSVLSTYLTIKEIISN